MHVGKLTPFLITVSCSLGMSSLAAVEEQALGVPATRLEEEPFLQPFAFHRYERDPDGQVNVTDLDHRIRYAPGAFIQDDVPVDFLFVRGLTSVLRLPIQGVQKRGPKIFWIYSVTTLLSTCIVENLRMPQN